MNETFEFNGYTVEQRYGSIKVFSPDKKFSIYIDEAEVQAVFAQQLSLYNIWLDTETNNLVASSAEDPAIYNVISRGGLRGNIELYFIDGDDLDTRSDLLWTVDRFKESRREPFEAGELWKVSLPGGEDIVAQARRNTNGELCLFKHRDLYEGVVDHTLPRVRLSTAEGEYVG